MSVPHTGLYCVVQKQSNSLQGGCSDSDSSDVVNDTHNRTKINTETETKLLLDT